MAVIRKKLAPTSQMYHVVAAALLATVSWTAQFFAYLDKTFRTYSVGNFDNNKAWHVTTKLGHALLLEMSKPREGTFDSTEAGLDNKAFNAQVVFYNTLRSLDLM